MNSRVQRWTRDMKQFYNERFPQGTSPPAAISTVEEYGIVSIQPHGRVQNLKEYCRNVKGRVDLDIDYSGPGKTPVMKLVHTFKDDDSDCEDPQVPEVSAATTKNVPAVQAKEERVVAGWSVLKWVAVVEFVALVLLVARMMLLCQCYTW